jgi:hypothetical protein
MIGLYPNELSILLMRFMDALVALALSRLKQEPEVGEFGSERARYDPEIDVGSEVRYEEEKNCNNRDSVGRDEKIEESHFLKGVVSGRSKG